MEGGWGLEFKNPYRPWSAEAPWRGSRNQTTSTGNTFQKAIYIAYCQTAHKNRTGNLSYLHTRLWPERPFQQTAKTCTTNYLATTKRKRVIRRWSSKASSVWHDQATSSDMRLYRLPGRHDEATSSVTRVLTAWLKRWSHFIRHVRVPHIWLMWWCNLDQTHTRADYLVVELWPGATDGMISTSLHRKTDDRNNMTMEQRTIIILWPLDRWQMHDDANSCRCHYVLIIHFLCFTLSLTNCCLKTRVTVHTDIVHFLNQWQEQRLESWGRSAWYNYRVVVGGGGGGGEGFQSVDNRIQDISHN